MAKLVSRLKEVAELTDVAAARAIDKTVEFIIQMIRIHAPVDTGLLRDSYHPRYLDKLNVHIGTMVIYAIFQEYGTSRQRGTPHLIPSMNLGGQFLRNELKKELGKL